jgi:predicted MFS family arabinose efflux permease
MLFGIAGLAGSAWISRHVGRLGPDQAVQKTMRFMLLGLALWLVLPAALGLQLTWLVFLLLAISQLFWGLGCFSSNSGQQARLVTLLPALASIGAALNTSALYAGQGLGAWLGGVVIANAPSAHAGFVALPWISVAVMAAALGVSAVAAHQRARMPSTTEKS